MGKGPINTNQIQDEYGGETGIRTLETVSRLHTFQACAFDHSATSPCWAGFNVVGRALASGLGVVIYIERRITSTRRLARRPDSVRLVATGAR